MMQLLAIIEAEHVIVVYNQPLVIVGWNWKVDISQKYLFLEKRSLEGGMCVVGVQGSQQFGELDVDIL